MSEIASYIKRYFNLIVILVLIAAVQTGLQFVIPVIIRELLEKVEINTSINFLNYTLIFFVAFLAMYLFGLFYAIFQMNFSLRFKTEESKKIYNDLFHVDYSFIRKKDPTYFVNRINQTVAEIYIVVCNNTAQIIITLATIVASFYFIYTVNIYLLYLFIILLPLTYLSYKGLNKKLMLMSEKVQVVAANSNKNIVNLIQNIEQIKQMGRYRKFSDEVGGYVHSIQKKSNEVNYFAAIISTINNFVIDFLRNGILLLSIYLYSINQLVFADVMFVNLILSIYFQSLGKLTQINISLRDFRACLKFLNNEIKAKKEIDTGNKLLETVNTIELAIKNFGYRDDEIVIHNLAFSINKNEKIALVGQSGVGKSTLAKLLVRLYQSEGVRINGIPVSEYALENLRAKIYVVTQNPYLFPGTIRNNITVGMDSYCHEKLARIVSLDFLSEFAEMQNGLDTEVREGGANLSGGQKQKIALARMLMYDPELIIFDESTSSLDSNSENTVFQDIKGFLVNKTVIFISHRASTIKNTDRVVVLKEGNIEYAGSRQDLMNSEEYSKLFSEQLEMRPNSTCTTEF